MTTLRDRLLAPAGDYLDDQDRVEVDVGAFVRRLLLFDEYILDSTRMREIPDLVSVFGSSGVITLLESGSLKILTEGTAPAQTGQTVAFGQGPVLPPCCYRLMMIFSADREDYVRHGLKKVDSIGGMTVKQTIKLKRALVDHLVQSPKDAGFDSLKAARQDLEKSDLLKQFVSRALTDVAKTPVSPSDIEIRVHSLDANDFRLESNLARFALDDETIHRVLERAVVALTSMNYRIEEMRNLNALSGIVDDELGLMTSKFDFVVREASPALAESRFSRVVEVAGLPDLPQGDRPFIDAEKLLKVRQSRECAEFRNWIHRVDDMSDKEMREQVAGLTSKVGSFLQGGAGKTVRFLVTSAIGAAFLNPAVGIAASAIDGFLLDKIFRQSGPAAFINRLYPSIFPARL